MKNDPIELALAFGLALACAAIAYDILDGVTTPTEEIVHEMRIYPPAIPQCDKEVWDRITEGCE